MRLINIIKIATNIKISLSEEISFTSIILLTILLIKRFKIIYNYIIRLIRKIIKIEIV